jgi:hypothetical protein
LAAIVRVGTHTFASVGLPPLGTAQHLIVAAVPVVFENRTKPLRKIVVATPAGTVNKLSGAALSTWLGVNSSKN